MATEEWLFRAIQTKKNYEDLPPRVRSLVSVGEWKARVREYCISRELGWGESQASQVCAEMDYYEALVRHAKGCSRLFPYHLADYITRVLRVTPFRYYSDIVCSALKEEKPYDQIPNFTAADIMRLLGIGRNEYIEILNQCKAKKLLWRVNKGIAREFLPLEPVDTPLEPWWQVSVVNIGEMEYRALTPEELKTLQAACHPGGNQVAGLDAAVVRSLFKRGLLYIDVPILPDDAVTIPHLEGFVSNRDSVGSNADPLEQLLHQIFVAASENITVAELAEMLSVDLSNIQAAVSVVAVSGLRPDSRGPTASLASMYLRGDAFAGPGTFSDAVPQEPPSARGGSKEGFLGGPLEGISPDASPAEMGLAESASGNSKAVALVVDATVTSFLMMGNLPGLKRHAVTLFEGGRVSGAETMNSLIEELQGVSEERLDVYEGEMQELVAHTRALAQALEFLRSAAPGGLVELLRRESLGGLSPAAAARLLSRAYLAVVPVAPMPGEPLPLAEASLVNYGPTYESCTPWMQLALGQAGGCGLPGVVFVCGQRVWRLPAELGDSSHALLWPWDASEARAPEVPVLVDAVFLLATINDLLTRTPVLVQPLRAEEIPPGEAVGGAHGWHLDAAYVPLPVAVGSLEEEAADGGDLLGVSAASGELSVLCNVGKLVQKITHRIGLPHALGYMRMVQAEGRWVPLDIHLGIPLFSTKLCQQVCSNAKKQGFLSTQSLEGQASGHDVLRSLMASMLQEFSRPTGPRSHSARIRSFSAVPDIMPNQNLLFDGVELKVFEVADIVQDIN
eukprot:CAMPEP_0177627496 /NCGR_PEP_ID=MMETSP0419_2-20121207/31236_1 /TAXON_ID=582737 /ORGANISM="Tetraselmis sp., Strain GSL018" /LENGTH=791 /DNA_ID=CAMNT_0019128657 /DNA_START=65 /DNA_END=2441 /DNA_ORIENTATION=+